MTVGVPNIAGRGPRQFPPINTPRAGSLHAESDENDGAIRIVPAWDPGLLVNDADQVPSSRIHTVAMPMDEFYPKTPVRIPVKFVQGNREYVAPIGSLASHC